MNWYNDAITEEDLAPLVRFFEDYDGKVDDPAVRVNDAEPRTADLKPFAFVVFVLLFFLWTVLMILTGDRELLF